MTRTAYAFCLKKIKETDADLAAELLACDQRQRNSDKSDNMALLIDSLASIEVHQAQDGMITCVNKTLDLINFVSLGLCIKKHKSDPRSNYFFDMCLMKFFSPNVISLTQRTPWMSLCLTGEIEDQYDDFFTYTVAQLPNGWDKQKEFESHLIEMARLLDQWGAPFDQVDNDGDDVLEFLSSYNKNGGERKELVRYFCEQHFDAFDEMVQKQKTTRPYIIDVLKVYKDQRALQECTQEMVNTKPDRSKTRLL